MSRIAKRLFPVILLLSGLGLNRSANAQWIPLGPDGGDVRSLSYDRQTPARIYLGTSSGQLFVSNDDGGSWTRFAHLGSGDDYVLDHVQMDPNSGTIYVSAWSVEQETGDLFRSSDGGRTWQTLPGMHGKSIRAMALAPSDPRIMIVGALDGVFRSRDGGNTWERISPPHHAEIKNIESIAIDPRNPDVIYAGTWHLPWKTEDGGLNWHSIKNGVVDDSDVFSIIVDHHNSENVYLSACSGIYRSTNAAGLFHKVQGIPFSARRTRVLKQDPVDPAVVYAGTTEGLWKSTDSGQTWRRVSAANIIVNDVHIDPGNPRHLLLATDRSGVLASDDGGQSFQASNRGFAHRQVSSILADRFDAQTVYAGLLNDKEFGGVYVSHTAGKSWQQVDDGLQKLDVFALAQADAAHILAGTNHGIFELTTGSGQWHPINLVLREKIIPGVPAKTKARTRNPEQPRVEFVKSELDGRVTQLELTPAKWFAAASSGLFTSTDEGKSWRAGAGLGRLDFLAVRASGQTVLAATPREAVVSRDGGDTWQLAQVPSFVTTLYGAAVTPDQALWLATREGMFRSSDFGATWEHVLNGLTPRNLISVTYDSDNHRLIAVSGRGTLFVSGSDGQWKELNAGFVARLLAVVHGRLIAATAFDGVIVQPEGGTAQHSSAMIESPAGR
jgi:photosystem II stability/assembly factor-like uncharacterized protein